MARKHEPGTVVKTPSDRKAIILSAEKRGKKFYYQLEDEEGNKFEHIETGLTVTDSTPAEIDAVEHPDNPKNPLLHAAGFPKFRQLHPMQTVKMADGKSKKVQNNEDTVAMELLAWELEGKDIYNFPDVVHAGESGVLRTKYAHLNKGMQRMNIGNKVRGYRNAARNAPKVKGPKEPELVGKEEPIND